MKLRNKIKVKGNAAAIINNQLQFFKIVREELWSTDDVSEDYQSQRILVLKSESVEVRVDKGTVLFI